MDRVPLALPVFSLMRGTGKASGTHKCTIVGFDHHQDPIHP